MVDRRPGPGDVGASAGAAAVHVKLWLGDAQLDVVQASYWFPGARSRDGVAVVLERLHSTTTNRLAVAVGHPVAQSREGCDG